MFTDEDPAPTREGKTPSVSPGNYSPVTVHMRDSVGAIFLGILAGILLIGWMRAEARYRALISRAQISHENHFPPPQ